MQKVFRKELEVAGKKLVLETGELATQANAAVLASYGETVVLATVVAGSAPATIDYFPLSVDYDEKLYAGGKISTSRFIKRENRPSERAILTGRAIDRSIRPLFPKDYQEEVQVIITVLSIDGENEPDVLSLIAVSAALTISDIPWQGPLGGIRVGMENGKFITNPTKEEKQSSTLDLVLATNKSEIVMIEAEGIEVEEDNVAKAMEYGLKESQKVIKLIEDFARVTGKVKKTYEAQKADEKTQKDVTEFIQKTFLKDFESGTSQDEGWFSGSLKILEEKFIKEEI